MRQAAGQALEMLKGVRVYPPRPVLAKPPGTSLVSMLPAQSAQKRDRLSLLIHYGLRVALITLGTLTVGLAVILSIVLLSWKRAMGPELISLESSGASVDVQPMSTPASEPSCGGPPVMTLLLVGSDAHSSDFATGFADVIRIARIDFVSHTVVLLAVPRDLWVPIPGLEDHGIVNNRIKTAYTYGQRYGTPGGGPSLLAQTLVLNFGLQVDHYVIIYSTPDVNHREG